MSYFTIKDESREEFQEKKSVFIGHAKRVHNEEEAREFIDKIKDEFKDARHNVYAYIIGENMGIQRYTDDGEPQGTAGIPVLDVIKKNGITDVVIVVTRYFGGILLGTGGLVRAYSKAAAMAIDKSGIVEKVKGLPLHINLDYDFLGKVQYVCGQNLWHIEDIKYTDKVSISILTETNNCENIKNKVTEVTSAKVEFIEGEEKYYFKLENRLYEDKKEN
ncbi:YigZ family protein [Clostridium botulinum C]|uniref:YigZ family protein n=1 Tax=Clostridium botulinum TaxID=1491 RepID=UPI001E5A9282|nr:YigZ family protein [Clostridium botulinum]MCD3244534.1 YigZ family protein [Clostridium botulinum C]MCD3261093.1 YigZ family protein [Clostridium botulinum C]